MKTIITFCILLVTASSCRKEIPVESTNCDIQKVYADNATKVTITNGIWGTVSAMEGNCMPIVPPSLTSCKNCPVKRTVKIYQYTLISDATRSNNSPIFFESVNTPLVTEIETDVNGFFQTNITPGKYTIVIVENGKLYANGTDGQGGLSPVTITSGTQQVNLIMNYKASF